MARPAATVAIVPGSETRAQSPAARSALAASPERLAGLADLTRTELYEEWRRQFRSNPPDRIRRDILELGIAWKLQEAALGGLQKGVVSELRSLADALAATGDIGRARPPRLKPGARLVREWGGESHEVIVVETGFEWRGKRWKSLSSIASEITGAHWSGPRFFGLTSRSQSAPKEEVADA
jgi:hypothetical protein